MSSDMNNHVQPITLLAFPFRPFFMVTGIYGVITVIAWMSYLFGGIPLPLGWSSVHWHGHEMLFGLIPAAIAGFLLTAMCNWTGAPPLQGAKLFALICVWVAGRAVMWTATWWPVGVVAAVDLLFLPLMALYVLQVLLRHGNKRNLILVGILTLLTIANIMMHVGFITGQTLWLKLGQLMAFNVITLMMVVIGGRIIPLFTINWLRNNGGKPEDVKSSNVVDRAALIVTALLIPLDFISDLPWLVGIVACIAAVAHSIRLARWNGWKTYKQPLLWILHLGYAWIIVALFMKSAAAFHVVAPTAWQHALGVGGMGTLILAIMTRVALGHTGRPLILPSGGTLIYIGIIIAAVMRVAAALQLIDYRVGLFLAAVGWSFAFGLFVVIYWPILTKPRIDGRAG